MRPAPGHGRGTAGPAACSGEKPVGVDPTSTGLQPVAWPSGSGVAVALVDTPAARDVRAVQSPARSDGFTPFLKAPKPKGKGLYSPTRVTSLCSGILSSRPTAQ